MAIATDRETALGQTTDDLGQAGIIFNDAVRLSNGGLLVAAGGRPQSAQLRKPI
jgi:hypothetical protein